MVNDEKVKQVLSNNIKNTRIDLKLTQDELAEKAEISTQFLRDIESSNKLGSITTFVNLCIALDTTPNKILYELFKDNEKYNTDIILKLNNLSNRDKMIIMNLIENMSS